MHVCIYECMFVLMYVCVSVCVVWYCVGVQEAKVWRNRNEELEAQVQELTTTFKHNWNEMQNREKLIEERDSYIEQAQDKIRKQLCPFTIVSIPICVGNMYLSSCMCVCVNLFLCVVQ